MLQLATEVAMLIAPSVLSMMFMMAALPRSTFFSRRSLSSSACRLASGATVRAYVRGHHFDRVVRPCHAAAVG